MHNIILHGNACFTFVLLWKATSNARLLRNDSRTALRQVLYGIADRCFIGRLVRPQFMLTLGGRGEWLVASQLTTCRLRGAQRGLRRPTGDVFRGWCA